MVKLHYKITGESFCEDFLDKCRLNYVHESEREFVVFTIDNGDYKDRPYAYDIRYIVKMVKKFGGEYNIIDFVSTEHYVTNDTIQNISESLEKFNILILSCNLAGNRYNTHMFYSKFLFELQEMYDAFGENIQRTFIDVLSNKKRNKKMLFLNNRLRLDRIVALEHLYKNDLLNDMIYSCNESLDNAGVLKDTEKAQVSKFEIINKLPIHLDTIIEPKNGIDGFMAVSLPTNFNYTFYYQTYIELIFETHNKSVNGIPQGKDTIIHLTEKLFKPLVFGFPFLAYGCSDLESQLTTKLNLKLNSPMYVFNENYNFYEFMDKVKDVLELPYDELHKMWYECMGDFKSNQSALRLYNNKLKRIINTFGG